MNEKFFELSKEKQQRIINATMEVFACNDYKHASTDVIAAKSGVSKGLLFYYFHNKKELFLYVLDYCINITFEAFNKPEMLQITDFFDILEYGAQVKMNIIENNPFITDFIMHSYFSEREEITEELNKKITQILATTYNSYFAHIDKTKFKENIDIIELYRMLLWVGDGYLNERRRLNQPVRVSEAAATFKKIVLLFRQAVYKQEYI